MYLLDTSAASAAVNPRHSKHAAVQSFLKGTSLFADQLFLSTVTIAEVQIGFHLLPHKIPTPSAQSIEEVRQRVLLGVQLGTDLPVTRHVAHDHARLKIAYALKFAPNMVQRAALKSKPVELWHEGLTARSLQVTENDLWIAATAITHDLILLTADRDHDRMRQADPRLKILLF